MDTEYPEFWERLEALIRKAYREESAEGMKLAQDSYREESARELREYAEAGKEEGMKLAQDLFKTMTARSTGDGSGH